MENKLGFKGATLVGLLTTVGMTIILMATPEFDNSVAMAKNVTYFSIGAGILSMFVIWIGEEIYEAILFAKAFCPSEKPPKK